MEAMKSLEIAKSEAACSDQMDNSCDGKSKKMYSLIPDLITGWKPKNIKIPSPVLIKYKSPLASQLIDYYQDDLKRLIYIGPRYTNSLMFHQHISHEYMLKFGITTEDIPKYLKKQLSLQEQQVRSNRIFQGMNPTLKDSNFVFNSHFQSGNLDLVVQVSQNQYNLFLRPDTNTCGHMQWFYFTIRNRNKEKVKLNICNNRKAKTLYSRGMKPYVLSKYMRESKAVTWQQAGENLNYTRLVLAEQGQDKQINGTTYRVNNFENNFCLSFDYTFEYENDEVSFAYSPPYTFSHLKNVIMDLKKNYNCFETIITEQKFCTSLSGIDIPLLTITDSSVSSEDKICMVCIGRIHPGQSNGSFVTEGFLKFILSEEAREMRKHAVFKVVPMINPDGVIFGNYRTSLSGKDLNRMFRAKDHELIPEVNELKSFIKKLKCQQKHKVTYFLDFHGHSLKKNVFFYGPEYDIWSVKYDKAKILPKLLSGRTELFRMKSCLFKVASVKKTTARAFMLAYIPYCYTVESSLGIYKDGNNVDHPFTIRKWNQVGYKIGECFSEIVIKIVQLQMNALKRKQKKIKKSDTSFIEYEKENQQSVFSQKIKENQLPNISSKTYLNPIRHLKKRTVFVEPKDESKEIQAIEEEQCESDRFSEGNSDCESVENDLPKAEYEKLKEKIVNMIDAFQMLMVGYKKQSARILPKDRKLYKISKGKDVITKKASQKMLLVPSLKHRIVNLGLSEKKISVLSSFHNLDTPTLKKMTRYGKQ